MRADGDHTTAERERLALYLLGALDSAERESFEEHLASCWRCLGEAVEIGPSTGGLVGLGDEDWAPPTAPDLPVAQPQAPATARGGVPAVGSAATVRERGDSPDEPVGPAGSRPGGRRPSGTRPASARARSRSRRLGVRVGVALAAISLAVAGGLTVVNEFAGDDRVLTARGEAPGYGASLSVTITTHDEDRSTIRITVTGLRPGIRYRLFAVTRDGATHAVRDWTASSGPQEVAAETSLAVDTLSFVTVGLVGGSAVVTAPILRDGASPR